MWHEWSLDLLRSMDYGLTMARVKTEGHPKKSRCCNATGEIPRSPISRLLCQMVSILLSRQVVESSRYRNSFISLTDNANGKPAFDAGLAAYVG
jgi:hypothetical protein